MKKTNQHIKFGIICSEAYLDAWQVSVLDKLMSDTDIELKLVILENRGERKKQRESSSSIIWNSYYRNRIQRKSSTLKQIAIDGLFEKVLTLRYDAIGDDNGVCLLQDEHYEHLANAGLDFIIDFSRHRFAKRIIDTPKYGVWAFQFGDPKKYVGSVPSFWEIYCQDVVTSSYLVCLTNEPNKLNVLHQGHLKTSISLTKNMDKMLSACTSWPLKVCTQIKSGNIEALNTKYQICNTKPGSGPNSLQTILLPCIQFKSILRKAYVQLFFTDYWNIGLVHSPIQEFLNPDKKHKVQWFPKLPKNGFMADPFGIYVKDQLHIIYEDLKFEEGIGKTASFLYDNDTFQENKIVIDEEFHMSYPFLLEQDGEIYCIPETYQANQVRLYRALDFPTKWTLEKVLIENYAGIDNTLFKHKGTWFMFSTDKDDGPHYNLNLHYADAIFGPWETHPQNPVKTDVRSARPAGTLFKEKGEIFRPSMDYSEKIEGRITINKITELTKHSFREEALHLVHPFKNTKFSDKVHTLSKVGDFTLVDGAKELFILTNLNAFTYKMKRVLNKVRNK